MNGIPKFTIDGLTLDQLSDLRKANRSPKTGRRLPKPSDSKLSKLNKVSNWNKLIVKGAAVQLTKIAQDLQITNDQDLLALTKAISKIESLMLNKLSELYEAQKAYELYQRKIAEK